jgi:hypothetical protein
MQTLDLKKALEAFNNQPYAPDEYYLIYSRGCWESAQFKEAGYGFSKEELDAAEKLDVKLIGERYGVKCYLPTLFK